jgi:hypothetical protein
MFMDLCRDETQVGQLGRLAIVTAVDGYGLKEREGLKRQTGSTLGKWILPFFGTGWLTPAGRAFNPALPSGRRPEKDGATPSAKARLRHRPIHFLRWPFRHRLRYLARHSYMKNRLLCLALALTVCLPAAPGLRAQEKREHKDPETELGNTMEKMNGAWRKLRKQVADPAGNAASLELVATISACAEKALTFKPARVEDVPAADREKFIADYQVQMKDFGAQVRKLEEALKADDNATAAAIVQKMGAMQKEGHKEFKLPDM